METVVGEAGVEEEAEVGSAEAGVVPWEHLPAVEELEDQHLRDLCPRHLHCLLGDLESILTRERPC